MQGSLPPDLGQTLPLRSDIIRDSDDVPKLVSPRFSGRLTTGERCKSGFSYVSSSSQVVNRNAMDRIPAAIAYTIKLACRVLERY